MMKCEQARRAVLLAESGELGAGRSAGMQSHLAACPECSRFRDEYGCLLKAVVPVSVPETPRDVLVSIRLAAGKPARPAVIMFRRPAVRARAGAAVLLLVAGAWVTGSRSIRRTRIDHMHAIMAAVSESDSEALQETARPSLETLADQLLLMEGMAADDVTCSDWPTREAQPDAALHPTALRLRSSGGSPGGRCV